jgi:adenine-specific DNA glycosylase
MRLLSFSLLMVTALSAFANAASFADLAAQIPACDVCQPSPSCNACPLLTYLAAEMCATSTAEVTMLHDKHDMSLH